MTDTKTLRKGAAPASTDAGGKSHRAAAAPAHADRREKAGPQFQPLRPRPRLFIALLIVLALWITALLVMYFTTVYPYRHPG